MKIWVTRNSAFSIQCGGLERLFVWFRKPRFIEEWRDQASFDLPFGEESELNGARISDWECSRDNSLWISSPVSFGKLFGYTDRQEKSENEIAEYVWGKLTEHFGNTEFDKWDQYEKENPQCCRKNFLLEIELNITMK